MSADRPKSEPMGIGIPSGAHSGFRQQHCPGAMLRVRQDDYRALKSAGEVFTTDPKEIRADGYSDARVFCNRDVAELRVPQYQREDKSVVVASYALGLCNSCAAMERANRASLAARPGRSGGS